LGKRETSKVIAAVDQWAAALDKRDPAYEHNVMEALWVHQWHNVVNADLLSACSNPPNQEPAPRRGRVLCYWRIACPTPSPRSKSSPRTPSPVRLEAGARRKFLSHHGRVDVALNALKRPTDYYLITLSVNPPQLERGVLALGRPMSQSRGASGG